MTYFHILIDLSLTPAWETFWQEVSDAWWENYWLQNQIAHNLKHFWRDVYTEATRRSFRLPHKPKVNGKQICRVPDCDEPLPRGRSSWHSREHMELGSYQLSTFRGAVLYRDKGICQLCGTRCDGDGEADHIVPVIEGGPTTLENGRWLCPPCHKLETRKLHQRRKAAGLAPSKSENVRIKQVPLAQI